MFEKYTLAVYFLRKFVSTRARIIVILNDCYIAIKKLTFYYETKFFFHLNTMSRDSKFNLKKKKT